MEKTFLKQESDKAKKYVTSSKTVSHTVPEKSQDELDGGGVSSSVSVKPVVNSDLAGAASADSDEEQIDQIGTGLLSNNVSASTFAKLVSQYMLKEKAAAKASTSSSASLYNSKDSLVNQLLEARANCPASSSAAAAAAPGKHKIV